jgi:hypothetical protein
LAGYSQPQEWPVAEKQFGLCLLIDSSGGKDSVSPMQSNPAYGTTERLQLIEQRVIWRTTTLLVAEDCNVEHSDFAQTLYTADRHWSSLHLALAYGNQSNTSTTTSLRGSWTNNTRRWRKFEQLHYRPLRKI